MSALERPVYSETGEIIKERIAEAQRWQRAWSVVAELYQTGASAEFGKLIRQYEDEQRRIEERSDSEMGRYDNSRPPSEESMHRAFGREGSEIVLHASWQVRAGAFPEEIRKANQ